MAALLAIPTALLDQPPATLNPRMTLDAAGQRLNALHFAALTRLDAHLRVVPDLAESWSSDPTFTRWRFKLASGRTDHAGEPISAIRLAECFNNYSNGKPAALAIQALTPWEAIKIEGQTLQFDLKKSDPYFARNATLLRYFRQQSPVGTSELCTEPKAGGTLIGSGAFRFLPFELSPKDHLTVQRRKADGSFEDAMRFMFIRDENTRTLRLMRGEAQIAQNGFSPTRTRWLGNKLAPRYGLLEASGVNVSYLAFNVRDPALRDIRVRRALAHAIPIRAIIKNKLSGMAEPATSFLSPKVEGAFAPRALAEDLAESQKLLDQAGYPRGPDGTRAGLGLTFKTTPIREGFEVVRVIQDAWKKIGIPLRIEVMEPAVFLASVRKGNFQLALGRWVGVADASILERTLRTGSPGNRSGYSSSEMDHWLTEGAGLAEGPKRLAVLQKIQQRMMDELPYFPLWFWKNALLYDRRLAGADADALSISGALAPLLELRER